MKRGGCGGLSQSCAISLQLQTVVGETAMSGTDVLTIRSVRLENVISFKIITSHFFPLIQLGTLLYVQILK